MHIASTTHTRRTHTRTHTLSNFFDVSFKKQSLPLIQEDEHSYEVEQPKHTELSGSHYKHHEQHHPHKVLKHQHLLITVSAVITPCDQIDDTLIRLIMHAHKHIHTHGHTRAHTHTHLDVIHCVPTQVKHRGVIISTKSS